MVMSRVDGILFNVCHWLCQCINPALAEPVALKTSLNKASHKWGRSLFPLEE